MGTRAMGGMRAVRGVTVLAPDTRIVVQLCVMRESTVLPAPVRLPATERVTQDTIA